MKPRPSHRWIAWLLPLFVLRAFVPAGFMLAPSPDGMQMVLCSGVGPATLPAIAHGGLSEHGNHAAHLGHAHHSSSAANESSHPEHSPAHQASMCVFAVGGTANAPTLHMAVLLNAPIADAPIDFITDPELNSLPILTDRIRGPPTA